MLRQLSEELYIRAIEELPKPQVCLLGWERLKGVQHLALPSECRLLWLEQPTSQKKEFTKAVLPNPSPFVLS